MELGSFELSPACYAALRERLKPFGSSHQVSDDGCSVRMDDARRKVVLHIQQEPDSPLAELCRDHLTTAQYSDLQGGVLFRLVGSKTVGTSLIRGAFGDRLAFAMTGGLQ